MVAGVVGLGFVALFGAAFLGTKAEPQFRQIPMGDSDVALDGSFDGGLAGALDGRPPATSFDPSGAALDDPVRVIIDACREVGDRPVEGPITPRAAFNSLRPGGEGQFAPVVKMAANGTFAWVGAIDLATGEIDDSTDRNRWDEMGRHATVVACVAPPVDLPGGEVTTCSYREVNSAGVESEFPSYLLPSQRSIAVHELATGEQLGLDVVEATVDGCPSEPGDPNGRASVDVTDADLNDWASEHLEGGTFG